MNLKLAQVINEIDTEVADFFSRTQPVWNH